MTQERLLRGGTTEERRLLSAALCDGPSPDTHLRVCAALGLAPVANALEIPHSDAYAAPRPPAHSGVELARPATEFARSTNLFAQFMPWVGLSALVCAIGMSAVGLRKSAPPELVTRRGTTVVEHIAPHSLVSEAPKPLDPQSDNQVSSVRGRSKPLSPSPTKTSLETATPKETRHGLEVQLIDAARTALFNGDAKTCLAKLDERMRRVGQGMLFPEASLLRVRALMAEGRLANATRDAERYLAQQPTGPIADRMRAAIATASTNPDAP